MERQEELRLAWQNLASDVHTHSEASFLEHRRAIALLAHDMRSSLGIIQSAESLLRRKYEANPDDLELLEMIGNYSRRMIDMINDLADAFDQ